MNEHPDQQQLLARICELESLCTEVLVAGVDLGLPQPLLNQLWGAVGHGELPHAFNVDLPPALVPIPDIPFSSNPLLSRGKDDSRPKPSQAELKPIGAKKTVAVVDDDPMMLDVLSRILQRENFELLMASGGAEIIQKLSEHPGALDLLVTDYAMPHMQGRELADQVRQWFPSVKVLYQTGFSDMLFDNRVELEEGAAFIEKPFTARGLREAARMILFGSVNP